MKEELPIRELLETLDKALKGTGFGGDLRSVGFDEGILYSIKTIREMCPHHVSERKPGFKNICIACNEDITGP